MKPGRKGGARTPADRAAKALKRSWQWLVAQAAFGALRLLRRLPPDRALDLTDRAARRLGPWFGRHRVALDNLRKAYPEKSEREVRAIALDMWGNMGRLAVEYVFLDRLFDHVSGADRPGRVEIVGEDIVIGLRENMRPCIVFTAHTGNFELLAVGASALGLPMTALFRPPNNPYLASYVFSARAGSMGGLLASRGGAALALARILRRGDTSVGVLVDQKFNRGVETTFFGRPCLTSPLVARLARQFECEVFPAHSVRLPDNRYRLVIGERLELPRDAEGGVDVAATCQLLNDVVEGWVRANPGQWMWFHKRWARR